MSNQNYNDESLPASSRKRFLKEILAIGGIVAVASLAEIGTLENVKPWLTSLLNNKERIMGF